MSGDVRPGADEPGVLEQLGFTVPSQPNAQLPAAAPAASSRREARALEGRPARKPKSAERRIRKVQKGYAKPKGRRGAPVVVSTEPTRPTPARTTTTTASRARTIGSRVLSVAAMVFAGALAVGMSVPANAFNTGSDEQVLTAADGTTSSKADSAQGQTMDVAANVVTGGAARDQYTVTSWAELLRLQYGTRDYSYEMGDPNGPIRWPFPYPVPISSGFGERNAPCRGCSSMHMGIDFTPGEGAPIYAVADGVVSTHLEDQWGFGNHVIIDHGDLLGDGTDIASVYAHMQRGSSPLQVGDAIKVGDFIGTVGMTGTATGNHLHFEIHVDGVQVDPYAWLRTNT